MAIIKIVTDNTTDLTEVFMREHGIEVVPLSVHFEEETYLPGVDLDNEQFYHLLKNSAELPKTSQVPIGRFLEKYQILVGEVDEVISLHLSSKFSGTLQSAVSAAEQVEGIKVYPVDSESISLGAGFQLMAALEALERGGDSQDALRAMREVRDSLEIYVYVETLEYLEKGGRIGKASSLVGSLLNIKPILQVKEGEIHPFEKVRGFKRGFVRLLDLAKSYVADSDPADLRIGIMQIENEKNARKLMEKLKKELGIEDLFLSELGPVVGTHIGPGVLGIILSKKSSH